MLRQTLQNHNEVLVKPELKSHYLRIYFKQIRLNTNRMHDTISYNYYLQGNKSAEKMEESEYDKLSDLILKECDIPSNFFPAPDEGEKNCYFMFRYKDCNFLFVDSRYESFTGYLPQEHQRGGLDFWFSKVHPLDRKMLGDRIIESLKIQKNVANDLQPDPHILNYRFKKGNGEWIWMQHTVYNISYDRWHKVDKVLHRLRQLEVMPIQTELTAPLHNMPMKGGVEAINRLTSREKQVLKLVAEGFSTKIIACNLKISVNTVETHRRHLLEKLEAKNSMELIKKAFTLFWN